MVCHNTTKNFLGLEVEEEEAIQEKEPIPNIVTISQIVEIEVAADLEHGERILVEENIEKNTEVLLRETLQHEDHFSVKVWN